MKVEVSPDFNAFKLHVGSLVTSFYFNLSLMLSNLQPGFAGLQI